MDHSKSPRSLHTLPLDILIDIFKFLPSFTYLLPLVLTHRAFNEVWKANFNEISQAIGHNEFEPWEDAINLMLEQRYSNDDDDDVIADQKSPMRLSKEDLAQMHTNAQYLGRLQIKHDASKERWGGRPAADSETELLRFRRASYRVWLFMVMIELPRCEPMCDMLSLIELIEMQSAAKHFDVPTGWPGLPDFSIFQQGDTVVSLEGVMRRRIGDYVKHDLEVDLDEVYDLKRQYASLGLQDPSVKGEGFLTQVDKLVAVERRWRAKKSEGMKPE